MSTTEQYLKTLRRIPDDIILSMATREFSMGEGEACLCGWAVREDIARAVGRDAADVDPYERPGSSVLQACQDVFGGTENEWDAVFGGVCNWELPLIEDAFVTRVMEAAGVAS